MSSSKIGVQKYLKNILTQILMKFVISNRSVQLIGLFFLFISVVIAVLGYINQHATVFVGEDFVEIYKDSVLVGDFYANISAELASIAVTVLILDSLNEWRSKQERKKQLLLQMGSIHNNITDIAIKELSVNNWLYDGSLKNAVLNNANLENADLGGADLEGAFLVKANLKNAQLLNANLRNTYLVDANLENANLGGADFTHAELSNANLKNATLSLNSLENSKANFEHANMILVDLKGVRRYTREQLLKAENLDSAIMPNGTKYEEWIKGNDASFFSKKTQISAIKNHVKEVSEKTGLSKNKIYFELRKEFSVKSYKEIRKEQFEQANEFLSNFESNWSD